jgi:WD40 repeat protein
VATFGWDSLVKVWDARDGTALFTLNLEDLIYAGEIVYSPNGKQLAFLSNNSVHVVDALSGDTLLTTAPFDSLANYIAYAPDGRSIAATGSAGLVRIYDSSTGNLLLEFTAVEFPVHQIVFSPDSKLLAGATEYGARIWDAATGKEVLSFSGHGQGVGNNGITFSPDGKWVATSGDDATIQVWDAQSGQVIFKLTGHTGPTFGVAFSPDGRSLATSSVDRTIKIWQLPAAGGEVTEPLTLYGNTGAVYRIAFSPDGTRLASAGRNPTARVYTLSIEELVAIAQSRLTRSLTAEECQKFLHVVVCPNNP